MQRRIPKRGFTNIIRKEYAVLNLSRLDRIEGADVIDPELLVKRRIVKKLGDGIKILGHGEIHRPLTVRAHKFSRKAAEKIQAAGGRVEVLG